MINRNQDAEVSDRGRRLSCQTCRGAPRSTAKAHAVPTRADITLVGLTYDSRRGWLAGTRESQKHLGREGKVRRNHSRGSSKQVQSPISTQDFFSVCNSSRPVPPSHSTSQIRTRHVATSLPVSGTPVPCPRLRGPRIFPPGCPPPYHLEAGYDVAWQVMAKDLQLTDRSLMSLTQEETILTRIRACVTSAQLSFLEHDKPGRTTRAGRGEEACYCCWLPSVTRNGMLSSEGPGEPWLLRYGDATACNV